MTSSFYDNIQYYSRVGLYC